MTRSESSLPQRGLSRVPQLYRGEESRRLDGDGAADIAAAASDGELRQRLSNAEAARVNDDDNNNHDDGNGEQEPPEPVMLMSDGRIGAVTASGVLTRGSTVVSKRSARDAEADAKEQLKRVSWWMAAFWMTAVKFGVGSLSLPRACSVLGIGGFAIANFVFGAVSTLGLLVLRKLKLRYKWFQFYADAGQALYGARGWYAVYTVVVIAMLSGFTANVFTSAIAIQQITGGMCNVLAIAIPCVAGLAMMQMRTMYGIKWAIVVAFFALLIPAMITIIYVPVNEGAMAPNLLAFGTGEFTSMLVAIVNVAFAYGGSVYAPSFMSEMANAEEFDKTVYMTQGFLVPVYFIIGLVVYLYRGDDSLSPGFNNITGSSALRKAVWALALVHTLIVTAQIGIAIMQDMFTRAFGWRMIMTWTRRSVLYYLLMSAGLMTFAFVLVNVVPLFSQFISLGSTLGVIFGTYGLPPLFMAEIMRMEARNRGERLTRRQKACMALFYFFFVGAAVIAVCGFVSTIIQIVDAYQSGEATTPFTC